MTMKLFISYRSSNSNRVDAIVSDLRSLKDADGEPQFTVWLDKDSIPAGSDWWQAIVDAIIDCDVFLFMVSHEAVQSENCRAELNYARRRLRPIVPVVLPDEFTYNPKSGKNDIGYWDSVPTDLTDFKAQFLFYKGTSFVEELMKSLAEIARKPRRDVPQPRPPDPREGIEANIDSSSLYDEAFDYALRLELATAERLFQKLAVAQDALFGDDAHQWLLILSAYGQMLRLHSRESTRYRVPDLWTEYEKGFPKPFIKLFDPKPLQPIYGNGTPPNIFQTSKIEVIRTPEAPPKTDEPAPGTRMTDEKGVIMVYVPAGKFRMGSDDGDDDEKPAHEQIIKAPFWLDLTPVTNESYAQFMADGGYQTQEFWTPPGWQWAQKNKKPKDYGDFGDPQQPRVGVTWYEAYAYCQWRGGRLPTEAEWEWAARGKENRVYPWGDEFKPEYVVYSGNSGGKTAVVGDGIRPKGASWVGALDMSGNVWEWCNSLYLGYAFDVSDGRESTDDANRTRVLRGGSWGGLSTYLRAAYRGGDAPGRVGSSGGFRCVRS